MICESKALKHGLVSLKTQKKTTRQNLILDKIILS